MGQTTPNIGIYIPAAGETNYEQSFAAGMMNIDQHDHSGGPNKGVPITNSGLADFSVTYNKLNSNVVNILTGIGTEGGALQNRLQLLGYIANLYQRSVAASPVGFVVMNGGVSEVRTFQNSATVTWTNANGAGNPSASLSSTFYSTGTFVPTAVASGTPLTNVVYQENDGNYEILGNWVLVEVNLRFTCTAGTGNLSIGAIPGLLTPVGSPSFSGISVSDAYGGANQQTISYEPSGTGVLMFPNDASPNTQYTAALSTGEFHFSAAWRIA